MKRFNTMNIRNALGALVVGALASTAGWSSANSSITEPPTTFYGRVIGTGGTQPFVLHEGELQWTVLRPDGSELQMSTGLYSAKKGAFSYQLQIPHAVDGNGLEPTSGIPMPPMGRTNEHARVAVDGVAAEFIGPAGAYFEVGQRVRAATYRLDLMVEIAPEDSDGDGIPDWWETLHQLNPDNPLDANLDSDGDGISNGEEYELGFNPHSDNRKPGLLTTHLLAYTQNTTGVQLKSSDADSLPQDLLYTLVQEPSFGELVLRTESESDLVLSNGTQFTQADIDAGRLAWVDAGRGSATNQAQFAVEIQDENRSGAPAHAVVDVHFYEPPAGEILESQTDALRRRAHVAGRGQQMVLWDAALELSDTTLCVTNTDVRNHYFLGGRGNDTLCGGRGNDILVGRQGENQLTGGAGADQFVFNAEAAGTNRVTDFRAEQSDVLNFSAKLSGAVGRVDEQIQLVDLGGESALRVGDLTVILQGQSASDWTLYDWVLGGFVRAGDLQLKPRLSVVATDSEASENGGNSGTFAIEREGDASQALTAHISLSGSAINGSDYRSVASAVEFAAGQTRATVQICPFADNKVEPIEQVELILIAEDGYCVGASSRASISIRDLQSVVEVEALEALATMEPTIPGQLMVKRSGQLAKDLMVRLAVAGSASNGRDYQYVASFVHFAPGQSSKIISIAPLADASLSANSAKTVDISAMPSEDYVLGDCAAARVTLVHRRDSFAAWRSREFPQSNQDEVVEFAHGGQGVEHLLRYAYGMDPHQPDRALLPQLVLRDGHMTVDIHRNPSVTDVSIAVEVSRNLVDWSSSSAMVHRIVPVEHAASANWLTYEVVPLLESEEQLFVRVRVQWSQ